MQAAGRRFRRRRAAIAPMVAIFLIFLLAVVAFTVDLSWVVLAKSELQNAADAAALAGAQQLVSNFTAYNLPGQSASNKSALLAGAVSQAQASAKAYTASNAAGGASTLTLLDQDILVGFTSAAGVFTGVSAGGPFPNTVKVTVRRDSQANSPLTLFFAPVLGMKTMDLSAPASATLYTGVATSFMSPSSTNISMLPMTYDVNAWNNFLATGKDPDGNTSVDANGNPEIVVYPSVTAPGNFGLISLNGSTIGASTTSNWISSGVSSSDIQALIDKGLIPLTNHPANTWDWQGDSGFTASNVSTLNNYVGKVFWLPLFQPYNSGASTYAAGTGQGSNYFYDVVAFVPVQIVPVQNTNRQVAVQPATLLDPSVIYGTGTVTPAGTSSSPYATVLPPKLTR